MIALAFAAAAMLHGSSDAAAAPVTWYVRADGGSAAQCDGRSDAPYGRDVRRRACAWRHPFEALPPGGKPRIAGGDTLVIGAGSYRMGRGAPGTQTLEKCRADWAWDCHAAPVPSGPSAQQPTRIVGAGFDSGCKRAPQLWGSERAASVLDLTGSSNVEVACLEITDHSACIEFHKSTRHAEPCERDKAPYGAWAAAGIAAADAGNVRLADLDIHGLAHDGIRAGRLRDWTLERVRLVGNGWSGFSGDIGAGGSGDTGRMLFRDVEIAWNGCAESWPQRRHDGCWGEENGGYGDGVGTGATGGDWVFERVHAHHNAQDGIDLLHANANATITFDHVRAEANAGNQVKAGGSVTVEGSTLDGDCTQLGRAGGLDAADQCRAAGNAVALALAPGAQARISGNDIRGEGDCLIGVECVGPSCAGVGVSVLGNRLAGADRRGDDARLPCSLWVGPGLREARIEYRGNRAESTRRFRCPDGFEHCNADDER